jgi:putative MATE family efflux protein
VRGAAPSAKVAPGFFRRVSADRAFLASVLALALPISLQQVLTSVFSLLDVVMLGQVGDVAVASAALGGKMFGVLSLVLSGISGGVAIFAAQYWGKQDRDGIARVLGVGLRFALGAALPVSLLAWIAPHWLISQLSNDPALIATAGSFLRVLAIGFPLAAITAMFAAAARATDSVRAPLIASALGLGVNLVCNYALIYGNFGLPELGAQGAAIGTAFARAVECGALLALLYGRRPCSAAAATLAALLRVPGGLRRRVSAQVWPLAFNELLWSLGLFFYFAVYTRMGTSQLAAVSMVAPVESICIDLFVGFGSACAILLGRELGAGRKEQAYEYAWRFAVLGPLLALVVGAVVLLLRDPLLSLFSGVGATSLQSGRDILTIIAVALWFKVFNMVSCMGILRSGGDTRFVLLFDVGAIWLIGIPAAVVAGLVLELPVAWVYAIVLVEELAKSFVWSWRIRSRRWLNSLVA